MENCSELEKIDRVFNSTLVEYPYLYCTSPAKESLIDLRKRVLSMLVGFLDLVLFHHRVGGIVCVGCHVTAKSAC